MRYKLICTENNKVIMSDPRTFDSFQTAEYALSKRQVCDDIAKNDGFNWSITAI